MDLLKSIAYPEEVYALLKYKFGKAPPHNPHVNAISAEFRALRSDFREVISDITRRMGSGMLVYLVQCTDSMEQWDEHCHYVAGLVGIGLSRLFSVSKLEDAAVGTNTKLPNSMGLFLQKTNLIRDFLEDVLHGRRCWPRQVWSKYAQELKDLVEPEKRHDAITCMNELIMNALGHIPDIIKYLSRIQNQSVFNFCAIPQVMAIATLERCYNNPKVFTGVVKIRKGETVRVITTATNIDAVKAIFSLYVSKIREHASAVDVSSDKSQQCLQKAMDVTRSPVTYVARSPYTPVYLSAAVLVVILVWRYLLAFLLLFINIDLTD